MCAGARAYERERARRNEAKNKKSASVMSRQCTASPASRAAPAQVRIFAFFKKKRQASAGLFCFLKDEIV